MLEEMKLSWERLGFSTGRRNYQFCFSLSATFFLSVKNSRLEILSVIRKHEKEITLNMKPCKTATYFHRFPHSLQQLLVQFRPQLLQFQSLSLSQWTRQLEYPMLDVLTHLTWPSPACYRVTPDLYLSNLEYTWPFCIWVIATVNEGATCSTLHLQRGRSQQSQPEPCI